MCTPAAICANTCNPSRLVQATNGEPADVGEELGYQPGPDHPLFARPDGSIMNPDSLSKACVRIAKKAGLEGVHLHSLRHTQASLLIQQGEYPKGFSERLGHASTAFTNDVYGHLIPGMEKAAAEKWMLPWRG